jgi:4-hydroxybenzoate polyprenyltransferase
MTQTHLPDAVPDNWVDRYAPAALVPWLKLGRFDRPTGIWLLMLPGWMGVALADAAVGRFPDPVLLVLILVGATLMRSAGCAYNDIVDGDIDAQVERTAQRPIPAGQISVKQAWLFIVGCSLGGLVILLSLNLWAVLLGVLSLGLVAAYPFMKRITWWPQAWLGLTFNWGALLGYAAAMGGPSFWQMTLWMLPEKDGASSVIIVGGPPGWPAALLYAGLLFWTLGYDTIYAVQDLEDDALVGVKSSARRLGENAPRAVMGFYAATFVLLVCAAWLAGLGPLFLPLIAVAGVLLSRQAAKLDVADGVGALALFKSNTWVGLLMVAALAAGLWKQQGGAPF